MSELLDCTDYPDQYRLVTGQVLEYDASQVMHPDRVSEAIGAEAARVIDCLPLINPDLGRVPKGLEAGVGSAIVPFTTLSRIRYAEGVDFHGFDISLDAVETARYNVAKLLPSLGRLSCKFACRQADWHNEADRAAIAAEGPYDVIVYNPPYLIKGTPLFEGYETCPPEAVYSDSNDGLEQYRTVLPWLASMLSDAEGAAMIVRRPYSSDMSPQQTANMIAHAALSGMRAQPDEQKSFGIVSRFFSPLPSGRSYSATVIARGRGGGYYPPHMDPMVEIALRQGLDHVPAA